jgi:hypothetical protein
MFTDEASGNKQNKSKSESSSVSPQASRPSPAPILNRDYSGKGPALNQPPESWHLVYDQQQRRQQELLRTMNQRIESQNSHILEMNKYLAQAKKVSDQQDEKEKVWGERIKRVELEQRKNEQASKEYQERTTA